MKRFSVVMTLLFTFSLAGVACKKNTDSKKKDGNKTTKKANATSKKVKKVVVKKKPVKKTYSFDAKATKVSWTAFKYTRKAAVNGYFAEVTASGAKKSSSAIDVFKGLQLHIKADSLKTGNPTRDKSIATNFFKKFKGGAVIDAKVLKIEGKEKGKIDVELSLHGLKKTVVFAYTLSKEGKLVAKATIDMLKFGLKRPYKKLHRKCYKLHKGKDGKSKTWTDVNLLLTSQLIVK